MDTLEIGRRLTKLRKLNGFTKEEVAKYLNLDTKSLQQLEDNPKKLELSTLNKLSDLYNCSHDYILCKSNDEYKPLNIKNHTGEKRDLRSISDMNRIVKNIKFLTDITEEDMEK